MENLDRQSMWMSSFGFKFEKKVLNPEAMNHTHYRLPFSNILSSVYPEYFISDPDPAQDLAP